VNDHADRTERRLICPVQILKDKQDRSGAARHLDEI
jgi:hypothetical protein